MITEALFEPLQYLGQLKDVEDSDIEVKDGSITISLEDQKYYVYFNGQWEELSYFGPVETVKQAKMKYGEYCLNCYNKIEDVICYNCGTDFRIII